MGVEIYRNSTTVVRGNDLERGGPTLMVSFSPWSETPSLDRLGWAEKMFESRGWPAIHFIPADNDWFQSHEAMEAITSTRSITSRFDKIIAYGSSMGGYASMNFAGDIGVNTAIAVMPQFSVDREKVPFERRWPETINLKFRHDKLASLPDGCHAFVIYDPRFNLDRQHAGMITDHTSASLIPLPLMAHYGPGPHPLKAALDTARSGKESDLVKIVVGAYHQNKKNTSNYYFQLATRARHMSSVTRAKLLTRAKDISPNDPRIEPALKRISSEL